MPKLGTYLKQFQCAGLNIGVQITQSAILIVAMVRVTNGRTYGYCLAQHDKRQWLH